ncbi:MAG: hypothetical protein EOP48_11810 [Sphingobacteriales bacterium]|nr:MAG: hypothetical protein EOP48_11810 [Sphingobacteriales bacterium]
MLSVLDSLTKVHHFKRLDDALSYLQKQQSVYDSMNLIRVKAIVLQYGYPGKTLVDSPTNEVAFHVLKRYLNRKPSEFSLYLPILKSAAERKEIPFELYALVLDQSLFEQGKEQLYGTAMYFIVDAIGSNGMRQPKTIVWPIKDPATVNKRRKAIGIDKTVEEMAREAKFTYQVYTLKDVKKLVGN